jgi:hypothetical protein
MESWLVLTMNENREKRHGCDRMRAKPAVRVVVRCGRVEKGGRGEGESNDEMQRWLDSCSSHVSASG